MAQSGKTEASEISRKAVRRLMEPAAFIMTRRMLLGLKERAEGLRARALARAA
jgi:hypothetical protein